jgi:hypothetical protein
MVSSSGRRLPCAFPARSARETSFTLRGVAPVTTLNRGLALLRRFRIPLYACGVVVSVVAAYPGGLGAVYQNANEISQLNEEMKQLRADRTRMDQECVILANHIAIKEGLVEELIEGRRNLKEVTEEFARFHRNEPCQAMVLQNAFPGASEAEYNARSVLAYAEQRCGPGSVKEGVMNELHRQFRDMVADEHDD